MNRKIYSLPTICLLFVSFFSLALGDSVKQPLDATDLNSKILGEWTCIAYVKNIDDFSAEQEIQQKLLFLKGIQFKQKNVAVWIFDDKCTYTAQWNAQEISTILESPASYQLKQIHDERFLFVEWISNDVTILDKKPCYYVLRKSIITNHAISSKSDPVGRWKVVDFVKTIEQFDPTNRSMTIEPFLRGMAFLKNGTVLRIFEKNKRQQSQWRDNAVDYQSDYPAHFTIKRMEDEDYLFIEWISGDVTERGEKPAYYVLKKAG